LEGNRILLDLSRCKDRVKLASAGSLSATRNSLIPIMVLHIRKIAVGATVPPHSSQELYSSSISETRPKALNRLSRKSITIKRASLISVQLMRCLKWGHQARSLASQMTCSTRVLLSETETQSIKTLLSVQGELKLKVNQWKRRPLASLMCRKCQINQKLDHLR
jgi:hypothetical protein